MSIATTPPSYGLIRDHLHEDSEVHALADVAEKYFEKNPTSETVIVRKGKIKKR
jgi:negative regulator of sigma E activity